jgi:hypothetical protein
MATGPLVILAVIPPRTTPNTGGVQTDGEATHNRSVAGSRPASPTQRRRSQACGTCFACPAECCCWSPTGPWSPPPGPAAGPSPSCGRWAPRPWRRPPGPALRAGPWRLLGCADRARVNGGLGVRWTVGWVAATATPGLAARSGRRPPAARSTGCPARSGHAGGAEPRHRPGSVIAAPVETSVDQALDAPPPRTRRTTPPRPPSRRGDQAIVAPPLARPERPAPISVTRLSPSA